MIKALWIGLGGISIVVVGLEIPALVIRPRFQIQKDTKNKWT